MPEKQEVRCDGCQKTLRIPQKYWGKKVRCPQCSNVLSIPAEPVLAAEEVLDDVDLIEDDDPFVGESPWEAEDPYSDVPPASPPRRRSAAGSPKRKKKKSRQSSDGGGAFSFEKRLINGGVLGGCGMIVLAVVWLVAGILFLDRLFFYPAFLVVFGLVAIVKGLLGSE